MKAKIIVSIFFLLAFACTKDDNSMLDSIAYKSSFSAEERPIAIGIDKNTGFVFLANDNPSISSYSSKIQKFNDKGELQTTIFDFGTFANGLYEKYSPLDLCVDNTDLFVLVKPKSQSNYTWITHSGFCIFQCDLNGNLIKEFDFSQANNNRNYTSIAISNGYIYVTSGDTEIIKIDKNSGQHDYLHIPIGDDKSYLLVSDMVVESEDNIIITGQGPWQIESLVKNDVSICHITKLNFKTDQSHTFYSNSRTGIMVAMPNNPGLTIKDSRYIYLATFYGRSLEIYDKKMENKLIFQVDIKPDGFDETLPIDVAHYKDDIYIVDYWNSKVHIYSRFN